MNRLSRIATVSALVGVAGVSQALFFNSGVVAHPHLPKIAYGQVDSKFEVQKISGDNQFGWRNPFVVTPSPENFGGAPWSGDDTFAQNTAGRSVRSRWLSPFATGTRASSNLDRQSDGLYEFRYRFHLSPELAEALNANNRSIVGRWSSDNNSTARFGSVSWTHPALGQSPFLTWSSFTLRDFRAGYNELFFTVTNLQLPSGNNPTGLRVEFTSALPPEITPVPEPFTMALGAGALALAAARKRRKTKV